MPRVKQPASSFLSKLPVELRDAVYEHYMLNYVENAADTIVRPDPRPPQCMCFLEIEGEENGDSDSPSSGPPLARTCRQVASELAATAARFLKITMSSDATTAFVDVERHMRMQASLPRRCTWTSVRYLHLEYRTWLRDGEHRPVALGCLGDSLARQYGGRLVNLETLRITIILPRFMPRTAWGVGILLVGATDYTLSCATPFLKLLSLQSVELTRVFSQRGIDDMCSDHPHLRVWRGRRCVDGDLGIADWDEVREYSNHEFELC
ncbi:hypothetical protein Micbo1qcDRAFT_180305 [Microdochium bolleyi]|uniref:DUF7730 domain-containing protein n=1 Tax=Microdochium bolleyi TaxID=196109 RepID=A0A136IMD4_9PEZI|nr:hypothetical protein Micbo1qcDRAFT_180305 [Microdochium bolleyi]